MSKPSGTNSPTSSSVSPSIDLRLNAGREIGEQGSKPRKQVEHSTIGVKSVPTYLFSETYCGGYSGEDPPLPIPNREVKLTIADGTAIPGGRVGSRHFLIRKPSGQCPGGFLFCM